MLVDGWFRSAYLGCGLDTLGGRPRHQAVQTEDRDDEQMNDEETARTTLLAVYTNEETGDNPDDETTRTSLSEMHTTYGARADVEGREVEGIEVLERPKGSGRSITRGKAEHTGEGEGVATRTSSRMSSRPGAERFSDRSAFKSFVACSREILRGVLCRGTYSYLQTKFIAGREEYDEH